MPFRVAGVWRVISYFLETLADFVSICADILEQLGLSQVVDTLLVQFAHLHPGAAVWVLFSIVFFVTVSSPI